MVLPSVKARAGDRMGSKGSFVVSLDCEGLWGMADNESVLSGGTITQDSLGKAYEQISRA